VSGRWRAIAAIAAGLILSPAAAAMAQQDTIAEIRVHGNHTTPDADVRQLAGLAEGEPALESRLREAEQRLRASGRFAAVDLRRRLRSIADPSEVLVVIVVTEHSGVTADGRRPGTAGRVRRAAMWLPVVRYEDGYGFTYGARVTFVDAVGDRSRISVPLTWGGERRAALEVERRLDGPITWVRGVAAVHRRENPHFDLADSRQDAGVGIERAWTRWLRTGLESGIARVGFDEAHTRMDRVGVTATVDTRIDASFPRNAVHATMGWDTLGFDDRAGRVGRWDADVRGYVGAGGARVVALRVHVSHAGEPLPRFEQALLGGAASVRGYRAGHRAGDRLAHATAELRWPLTSPLRAGRFGVKGFADLGAAWAAGERLQDQRFDRGLGVGVYAGVATLMASVDVAWARTGRARGHVGLGVVW
jgi:outer membrane protein assembly factor BamA